MVRLVFLFKYFVITAAVPLLLVLNLLVWRSLTLGSILTLIFFIFYGQVTGLILLPRSSGGMQKTFGPLLLLASLSFVGAVVYYFFELSDLIIALLIAVVPLVLLKPLLSLPALVSVKKWLNHVNLSRWQFKLTARDIWISLLTASYLIFVAFGFYTLWKFQTGAAIRSPWWVVPNYLFVTYFIATFILLTILLKSRHVGRSLFLAIVHSAFSLSAALIVYQFGYGFDPIIHQATEKQIWQFGTISPKPFYYLGQYSVVVILSKLSRLSVVTIDKFLIFGLASIYLPVSIFYAFKNLARNKLSAMPLSILWLLVPYAIFIVTTPQALANVFSLVALFLSILYAQKPDRGKLSAVAILVLAALAAHPISGIPIAIFFLLLIISVNFQKYRKLSTLVMAEIAIVASLVMPTLFLLNSWLNRNLTLTINYDLLRRPLEALNLINPGFYFNNQFKLVLDMVYWYGHNVRWLMFGAGIVGLGLLLKKAQLKMAGIYFATFLVIMVNYFLLSSFISFDFLIDYERQNFQGRLLAIAFYFLWPLWLYAIYVLLTRIVKGFGIQKFAVVTLLSLFMTSSFYLSYPRDDDYHLDRGYNLTPSDIQSARYINEDGRGQDYIVLANQMNSAAALREFGFKRYYRDVTDPSRQYFYYPIPTGDPLYQFYLDMVYNQPQKSTALAAMDLVGVDTAYFVVNKYWDSFDAIVENAKLEADTWQNLNNGQIYIFKYSR